MGIDRRNCEAFVTKRWQNFWRTQAAELPWELTIKAVR
jgi:hypothetical protein